jgi:hypothetical protein
MALNFTGIKVSMSGYNVPSGALDSPYTPINGEFISVPFTLAIDKASVESAVPSDTWNTLISFLDTAIESKLLNDFNTTNTVDSYAELFGVRSNLQGSADNSDMYKNIVPAYLCSVVMYVKVS